MITLMKRKEFDDILHEYLNSLLQLAYMRCGNKELAKDLVQNTCIKSCQSYITKSEKINIHINYTEKKLLS